jgi:hypothetical protein
VTYEAFHPGQPWLDSEGKPIQAHGGSIIVGPDGLYYWYGENKEHTVPGSGNWHWGVRAYASSDLYNWTDRGLIIPPVPDDPESPLHPAQKMDRPHILRHPVSGQYVCWLKIMGQYDQTKQASTVLVADSLLGPYRIVRTGLRPLGMEAGDFDLVSDSVTGRGYYYFEKVHTDLICADLSDDYTDVAGTYSSHFPHPGPPFTREAPAHFQRGDRHYLVTSATTGYFPNPSEFASAPDYHGPWIVLGDAHPGDPSGTSFGSQVSSVFRHPGKKDLYIALADRWLPQLPEGMPSVFSSEAAVARGEAPPTAPPSLDPAVAQTIRAAGKGENTAIARYVWLPIRFNGETPVIDWLDEWRLEDFA